MFCSRDILIFEFLWNPQISKSVTSLLHNGSYIYTYFFWFLSTIKMKFGQILVCCMTNISNSFWFNARDWKLVLGLFIILLQWRNNKIWPYWIVGIYHFCMSLIHLFKKKMKSWHNWLLRNWSRLLN